MDSKKEFTNDKFPVMFSFTAGPNANRAIGKPEGTMQRTLNKRAMNDYDFFKECIKNALRSSLDGMAADDVAIAFAAPLSRGIYSGPHKAKIEKDFSKLLNEVLNEIVGPKGEKRLQYFDKVVLADVPK